jgi:ribosomal protein S18 acetylase RimI-like enzyme
VEKPYRGRGLGSDLLRRLERKVVAKDIGNIWTWTAGYEAPGFYLKQGYEVFLEMPDYYSSGHARVGVRKALDR